VVGEPPQSDLEEKARALCEVLNAYGVHYVMLGSLAARLQGAKVTTVDIDVAPAPALDNLERLAQALNTLRPRWRIENRPEGAKIDGRLEPRHFINDPLAVGLTTRLGSLDVVFRINGFEGNAYEALVPRALTLMIEDVELPVVAVEDIVTSKRAAGRRKDLEHLPILERFLAERKLAFPEVEVPPPSRDWGAEPDFGP
jgi:hypothetical protein